MARPGVKIWPPAMVKFRPWDRPASSGSAPLRNKRDLITRNSGRLMCLETTV